MLEGGDLAVGTSFRGATQTGAYRYLASSRRELIGYVDCGTFDRWVAYGGEDEGGPMIDEVKDLPSGAIAFVVDPRRRRQGLGTVMIEALTSHPDLGFVRLFEAGVEPENVASARCLEAAGFHLRASDPDFEGMLYYQLIR